LSVPPSEKLAALSALAELTAWEVGLLRCTHRLCCSRPPPPPQGGGRLVLNSQCPLFRLTRPLKYPLFIKTCMSKHLPENGLNTSYRILLIKKIFNHADGGGVQTRRRASGGTTVTPRAPWSGSGSSTSGSALSAPSASPVVKSFVRRADEMMNRNNAVNFFPPESLWISVGPN